MSPVDRQQNQIVDIKYMIALLVKRLRNGEYHVSNNKIFVSLQFRNLSVIFSPTLDIGDGYTNQFGMIFVALSFLPFNERNKPTDDLVKIVIRDLLRAGSRLRTVMIHEFQHFIDISNDDLPLEGKPESFKPGTPQYKKAGWEMQARWQEFVFGITDRLIDYQVQFDTWKDAKELFSVKNLFRLYKKSNSGRHVSNSDSRLIKRLTTLRAILLKKWIIERLRIHREWRSIESNSDDDNFEVEMMADPETQELLKNTKWQATIKQRFLANVARNIRPNNDRNNLQIKIGSSSSPASAFPWRSHVKTTGGEKLIYINTGKDFVVTNNGDGMFAMTLPTGNDKISIRRFLLDRRGQVAKDVKGMDSIKNSDIARYDTLYHYTSPEAALSIISQDAFSGVLSAKNESEDRFSDKSWWVSTTRSYTRFKDLHSGMVWLVLDGGILSNNYRIKPVDYWNDRTIVSETEERIFHSKRIMPLRGAIREVWIFLRKDEKNELLLSKLRKVAILAKTKGLKIKLINSQTSIISMNKNLLPLTILNGKYIEKSLGASRYNVRSGIPSYAWKDYLWLKNLVDELEYKNLNHNDISHMYAYQSDFRQKISALFQDAPKYPRLMDRLDNLMKKNGFKTSKELSDWLIAKWQKIIQRHDLIINIVRHPASIKSLQASVDRQVAAGDQTMAEYYRNDIKMFEREHKKRLEEAEQLGVTEQEIEKLRKKYESET